jgi:uncharacterized membrane protein YhaH (DUF805 family)
LGPMQSITTCLRKSFDFSGRATRAEFWWFALAVVCLYVLAVLGVQAVKPFFGGNLVAMGFWRALIALAHATSLLLLPVLVRRFHDIGIPAVWPLLLFAPLLIPVYLALAFFPLVAGFTPPFLLTIYTSPQAIGGLVFGSLALIVLIALLPTSKRPNRHDPHPLDPEPNEVPT